MRTRPSFHVDFLGCVESIGVGLVPVAAAQRLTPARFTLANDGAPVTPLVVRTFRCRDLVVGGAQGGPASIVQLGAVIAPPDGTGNINNYIYRYWTDDPRLAELLAGAGISVKREPHLEYEYEARQGGPFRVRMSALSIEGAIDPATAPSGSFCANWWQKAASGAVKMTTSLAAHSIGGARLSLAVNDDDGVAALAGGARLEFPLVQQFNSIPAARLELTFSDNP